MRPKEMKAGTSQLGSSSSPSFQSTSPALEASLLPRDIFLRLILLPPWIPDSCGAVQSWPWPFQWEDWLQQSLTCFLLPLSLAAAGAKITLSWDSSWADPPPPDCQGMKG